LLQIDESLYPSDPQSKLELQATPPPLEDDEDPDELPELDPEDELEEELEEELEDELEEELEEDVVHVWVNAGLPFIVLQ
jgi:hypothetical protein